MWQYQLRAETRLISSSCWLSWCWKVVSDSRDTWWNGKASRHCFCQGDHVCCRQLLICSVIFIMIIVLLFTVLVCENKSIRLFDCAHFSFCLIPYSPLHFCVMLLSVSKLCIFRLHQSFVLCCILYSVCTKMFCIWTKSTCISLVFCRFVAQQL